MEKPKNLSTINISIYVIIIILTIIKLVLYFAETAYSAPVIWNTIFNIFILTCSIIVIPLYKKYYTRMMMVYNSVYLDRCSYYKLSF